MPVAPQRVRCIAIREPGSPSVLEPAHQAERSTPPGWVRVKVAASGVNRADLLQRRGGYPPPPGISPTVPGLEYAGVVEEVGDGCRLRAPGDPVMGILPGEGYAETVWVPEDQTIRVPPGVDVVDAAAIPEVFLTAWDALNRQARLEAGESVLIHAVGSGVGTAALQLVAVSGALAMGTTRSPEKLERALAMGLAHGVPAQEGWVEELGARAPNGFDVILDLVGAAYMPANLRLLADGARWIVVGVPGGSAAKVELRTLMARRAMIRGTVLRARLDHEKAALARAFERRIVPLFEEGRLRPVIDTILPAEEASIAHERLEASDSFGKLLLRW